MANNFNFFYEGKCQIKSLINIEPTTKNFISIWFFIWGDRGVYFFYQGGWFQAQFMYVWGYRCVEILILYLYKFLSLNITYSYYA